MKDSGSLLNEIRLAFSQKDQNKLDSLLSQAPFVNIKDGVFHKEIAKVLSAIGNFELSKKELELAIRDNPEEPEFYVTLSELYIEDEEYEKAVNILKKALARFPHEERFYLKLGEVYRIRGEFGALSTLYELAYENTKNPYFKDISLISLEKEQKDILMDPQNIHITKFLSLFRGRDGIYARQWIDSKGNTGYTPVREPFSLKIAKNHLIGNYTIGLYQLREDNTVEFIVFDIDVSKKFLNDYFSSEKTRKKIENNFREVTLEISNFLNEKGIKSYIEDSGFKGYHVWIFLSKPISAELGRAFGRYVLEKLNIKREMINIEIFPKQAFLKSRHSLGNLIKLPLGIHRRSGKRSLFVDRELTPIEDQLSFLLDREKTLPERIESLYDNLKEELPFVSDLNELTSKKEEEREFSIEEDKEFNIILRRCPVIKALWDKVSTGGGLNSEESMVIIFTLGHLTNGQKIVNTILRRAGIFNQKSYLKSKLNGYPMGCPKIRKKIPYITINTCRDCFSGTELSTYPNPLIHLKEFEKEEKDIETVVFEYLDTFKKYEMLKRSLEESKETIISYMEEHGMDVIEIDDIKVERSEDGNDLYIRTGSNPNQKA